MVRKSSRLAARPRKFYGEDYLWDKEVRRAEAERDGPKGGATREKIGEDWNQHLEEPQERVERIFTAPRSRRPEPYRKAPEMSGAQRNLLFMNPGDDKIEEAVYWLRYGGEQPPWVNAFRNHLSAECAVL